MVTVRNGNHFGIAGYYTKMACDEGFIGIACTNSEAIMVPTFGRQAMLGSNPIAIAAPADPYPFWFDASTSVVTRGKLEIYNKNGEPLPPVWALDAQGMPTTDAPDVLANIVGKNGRRHHAARRREREDRQSQGLRLGHGLRALLVDPLDGQHLGRMLHVR